MSARSTKPAAQPAAKKEPRGIPRPLSTRNPSNKAAPVKKESNEALTPTPEALNRLTAENEQLMKQVKELQAQAARSSATWTSTVEEIKEQMRVEMEAAAQSAADETEAHRQELARLRRSLEECGFDAVECQRLDEDAAQRAAADQETESLVAYLTRKAAERKQFLQSHVERMKMLQEQVTSL